MALLPRLGAIFDLQHKGLWALVYNTQLLARWCGASFQRLIGVMGPQHHINHLPHQLAATARRIEAARKLAGFQKIAAEVFVGAVIGARGAVEEL